MITKATGENKALIEARFAQINEALAQNGFSIVINSFDDYFHYIEQIETLPSTYTGKGDGGLPVPGRYLLMPLDEPFFEIDANSRTITVPSVFAKNGVGIKGDHHAEILYFRIDKYFDATNLYNVDEIIINWTFQPASGNRNAETTITTDKAFCPDDEFDPDHIVFGWVVTKDMTPEKGTLSFSVSFVDYDGSEYSYALNTQVATVNINDSLVLEDPSILSTISRPTLSHLRNSAYTPGNLTPLANPYFVSGEVRSNSATGENYYTGLFSSANFNFVSDESAEEEATLNLVAQACSSDVGANIEYTWQGNPEINSELVPSMQYVEIPSDLAARGAINPHERYFVSQNDAYVRLTATSNPTLEAAWEDNETPIFVQASVQPIDQGGVYSVMARATCTTTPAEGAPLTQTSRAIDSISCIIPNAAKPMISLAVDSNSVMNLDQGMTAFNTPYLPAGSNPSYTFINGEAAPVINVSVAKAEGEDTAKSLGAICLKASATAEAPEFSNADTFARFKNEPMTLAISPAAGPCYVFAANRRNHTISVSEAAGPIQLSVTAPAVLPTVRLADNSQTILANGLNTGDGIISTVDGARTYDFVIEVPDISAQYENIVYSFMIKEVVLADANATPAEWAVASYANEGNVDEVGPIEVINDNDVYEFQIDQDSGYYVIETTALYHGTACTTQSAPFWVRLSD